MDNTDKKQIGELMNALVGPLNESEIKKLQYLKEHNIDPNIDGLNLNTKGISTPDITKIIVRLLKKIVLKDSDTKEKKTNEGDSIDILKNICKVVNKINANSSPNTDIKCWMFTKSIAIRRAREFDTMYTTIVEIINLIINQLTYDYIKNKKMLIVVQRYIFLSIILNMFKKRINLFVKDVKELCSKYTPTKGNASPNMAYKITYAANLLRDISLPEEFAKIQSKSNNRNNNKNNKFIETGTIKIHNVLDYFDNVKIFAKLFIVLLFTDKAKKQFKPATAKPPLSDTVTKTTIPKPKEKIEGGSKRRKTRRKTKKKTYK